MSDLSINPTEILQINPSIGETGNLHIYLPATEDNDLKPFVLGIHGGGWSNGDQTSYAHIVPVFFSLNVGVVLTSYRKIPDHPFPAAYDDLIHVLGWLAQHGKEHGLDTGRCMLFGSSAGGHLAMLLATRATAEDALRPHLCGVVECCGIMDLVDQFAWDHTHERKMTQNFLGATPDEAPDLYRLASPIAHVHAKMPPVWMTHGDADIVVPVEQSRKMVKRLKEVGVQPVYHENPEVGHSMRLGDPPRLVFQEELLAFAKQVMHGPSCA